MNTENTPTLNEWIAKLRDGTMPIFGATAREISSLAENENASMSAFTQAILQDASMTAKLLKLANSAYFNPAQNNINTVSRAVIVLGIEVVRSMIISIRFIETLLSGGAKRRVMEHVARSLHAAVQARSAAIIRKDSAPEEVFIAALLTSLGGLAFWCFSGDAGERLDEMLCKPGITEQQAEMEVLGFRMRDLTAGLAKEWNLPALLQNVVQGKAEGKRELSVVYSYQLVEALEYGWETARAKTAIEQFSRFLGVPSAKLKERIKDNARAAANLATQYGAPAAAKLIPRPTNDSASVSQEAKEEPIEENAPEFLEPDPVLQLKILRELANLQVSKPDINSLLQMVLEGIYRGMGMDRTLFALITPDRSSLKSKHVLGINREILTQNFNFPIKTPFDNLITEVLTKRQSFWVKGPRDKVTDSLMNSDLKRVLSKTGFMITPIVVKGAAIGVFYTDRLPSGRELNEGDYESFLHFAKQANLGLDFLARSR